MGKKSVSKFRDTRLDKAHDDLLEAMSNRYSSVLHQVGKDKNEETRFCNFINNPKVTPKRILNHHWNQINDDWSSKHILVVSDSSTISFPYRADREELGYVGPNTNKSGFDIHPSLFLEAANGAVQGVGGLEIITTPFARTAEEKAAKKQKTKERWKRSFEDKERYKWFGSPKQAIENSPTAAQYTLMGDRETDIYDLIHLTLDSNWDFIYRSKSNRLLSSDCKDRTLYDALNRWKVEHIYQLDLPKTKKRSKHQARMEVKFGTVNVAKPSSNNDGELPSQIPLQVVEVKESNDSVVGNEKPVHWIILTSHPVFSIEQSMQIIKWYQWRWTIEELFRTIKTKGLNIEASEVETLHGLSNLTTMCLLTAVQTMQLVNARDGQTDQKMDAVFFEKEQDCLLLLNHNLEGQTDKTLNPFPPDSLAFATWVIARLGGWNGYRKSRPPGPITITRGLVRFYHILEGFYLLE